MIFVDEATIVVKAGDGGKGIISFLREKYRPFGGPDGGDGGDGGNIYLVANAAINTLVDFRHKRQFFAENGAKGGHKHCRGKSSQDLFITVPVGTVAYDATTHECIGELLHDGQQLLVAQGGYHGLGNARFKSSTNRAPRRATLGTPGEERSLFLELKLLADVGLVGCPNAGKSTLIRAVSAATPKVADYPFTTLHPYLGVVSVSPYRSFVMADIPGLISGAADGAGLGLQFLKHVMRTRMLLHVVDIYPTDGRHPVEAICEVTQELEKFEPALLEKPRWLVLNKIDLLEAEECSKLQQEVIERLGWTQPIYLIAAATGEGCKKLISDIMHTLEMENVAS